MHVRRGEVVILAGPNGSGKTTIPRTLAGFVKSLEDNVKGGSRGVFYTPEPRSLMEALEKSY